MLGNTRIHQTLPSQSSKPQEATDLAFARLKGNCMTIRYRLKVNVGICNYGNDNCLPSVTVIFNEAKL